MPFLFFQAHRLITEKSQKTRKTLSINALNPLYLYFFCESVKNRKNVAAQNEKWGGLTIKGYFLPNFRKQKIFLQKIHRFTENRPQIIDR